MAYPTTRGGAVRYFGESTTPATEQELKDAENFWMNSQNPETLDDGSDLPNYYVWETETLYALITYLILHYVNRAK